MNKVLVTGSNGFVGKGLVNRLNNTGFSVFGFDKDDGNIANSKIDYKGIQHVFHLAGLTYVPDSWEHPKEFYDTNTLGTCNVLDFCRVNHCSLTYVSSYMYGIPEILPINESHPVNPNTPYNHSKFLGEELCKFYNNHFHVPVIILRPFNIYGPGQNKRFIIPKIIGQVLDNSKDFVSIQNLLPKRDFLFIEDFLDALLRTLTINEFEIFNIGSGYSVSVKDIIELVMEITGIRKRVVVENEIRKNEIQNIVADIKKFTDSTGWKPSTEFKTGIGKTVNLF
jgi:nucleoside-diphosphate-sugar epimerase